MLRRARTSTEICFFLAGFGLAAWAALVPFVKVRVGLSDGGLGVLLLCLGLGSVVAMPVSGVLAGRFGCRMVISGAALLAAGFLPLLAVVSAVPMLGVCLLLFGAGVGALDVATNMQGIVVERRAGRPLMSGFHALFSVGGIAGAGGMALLFAVRFSPLAAALSASWVMVLGLGSVWRDVLAEREESGVGPVFAMPRGVVWSLSGICFVSFLAEGAVLDWSGVFLTTVRHVAVGQAGWGFAVFATLMTVGRFLGNRIVGMLGAARVVLLGSGLAMEGFLIVSLIPVTAVAFFGYALVGLGCANIVPISYSAVGRQQVMPDHLAVAAVTMLGYAGILTGPVLIGLLAGVAGLKVAFLVLAGLLVFVAVASGCVETDVGSGEAG